MVKNIFFGVLVTFALLLFGFSVLFIDNILTPSGPVFVKAQGRFAQDPIVKNENGSVTIEWKTQKKHARNAINYKRGTYRPKQVLDGGISAISKQDLATGLFINSVTLTARDYKEGTEFIQHGDYFFQAESSDNTGQDQNISEVIHFKID